MPAPAKWPSLRVIWWVFCWLLAGAFCVLVEVVRSEADLDGLSPWLGCIGEYASDSPMFLPLVVALPFAWWCRSGLLLHRSDLLRRCTGAWAEWCVAPDRSSRAELLPRGVLVRDWCLALAIGGMSLSMSWQVSRSLGDLPPAFHDEYSYLFQAKTLLAGRFSVPSHASYSELFDQLHVLNLGQFASRYYPGTGLWLMPWVALGHPYWGQWLAGALTAILIFWTGRELSGTGVGVLAGTLTALSPGLALFSNLLLAHHPTLLGLALFLFGFIRWMSVRRGGWLLLAGCGLSFAMICRPATAAGVGLPFGLWFGWWLVTATDSTIDRRLRGALLLGGPLVAGWGLMVAYNSAITGHWWQSPYQLYTDHYTPRHVYGFNNAVRGAKRQGPRELPIVTRNYDAWAENLNPELALKNVGYRLVVSWRWTLGIVPLAWICLAALGMYGNQHAAWKLIAGAIVSLHVIHVPYWFDGIMHWHYVFESSLLWLLLVAGSAGALIRTWQVADRPWLIVWLGALLSVGVVTNYVACPPFWLPAIHNGIAEIRFPRRIYGAFRQQLKTGIKELPALVLVIPDPADRHMDFVTNDPQLNSPILIGRYVREELPDDALQGIAQSFPGRHLYLYDAKTRQLNLVVP